MMTMEPALAGVGLAMPKASVVGHGHRQEVLRPTPQPQTTICHTRVKSLDSFTLHDAVQPLAVKQAVAAEGRAQALQAELDRTRLVYGELLSAQDAEILRLRSLLNSLGVDGDGLPLEADPLEA